MEENKEFQVEGPVFRSSPEMGELFASLAIAQKYIVGAVKDASNPFFKSKYADLASVWDACHGPLNEAGISIIQLPASDPVRPDVVTVTTMLGHKSGQWISCSLSLKPAKADAQGMGSVISYARRYTLAAITGVCYIEDDDGNAASAKTVAKQQAPSNLVSPSELDKLAKWCEANHVSREVVKKKSNDLFNGAAVNELNPSQFDTLMKELAPLQKESN